MKQQLSDPRVVWMNIAVGLAVALVVTVVRVVGWLLGAWPEIFP